MSTDTNANIQTTLDGMTITVDQNHLDTWFFYWAAGCHLMLGALVGLSFLLAPSTIETSFWVYFATWAVLGGVYSCVRDRIRRAASFSVTRTHLNIDAWYGTLPRPRRCSIPIDKVHKMHMRFAKTQGLGSTLIVHTRDKQTLEIPNLMTMTDQGFQQLQETLHFQQRLLANCPGEDAIPAELEQLRGVTASPGQNRPRPTSQQQ